VGVVIVAVAHAASPLRHCALRPCAARGESRRRRNIFTQPIVMPQEESPVMASRFEIVIDPAGKFHFVLRGSDGSTLLQSKACDSKIMAQNAVMHARSALKDESRLVEQKAADGKPRLAVVDKDESILAVSPGVADLQALQPLRENIRAVVAAAPIVDLSKRATTAIH
jgi:uncharacterized protein YegP (UPF0339 family)